jgi:hypothetical protein
MPEFLIQTLVSLMALLLWFLAVSLLARTLGVRLPPRWPGRKNTVQSRTFSQHLWIVGVLYWGCSMFIVTTLWDYLDWKYWDGPSRDLSLGRVLFGAVWWPASGLFFGWMTWNNRDSA